MVICLPIPLNNFGHKMVTPSWFHHLAPVISPYISIWAILDSNQWPLACRVRTGWFFQYYKCFILRLLWLYHLLHKSLQQNYNSGGYRYLLLFTITLTAYWLRSDNPIIKNFVFDNQSKSFNWAVKSKRK